ncbi:PEP-CTERM sorting domain-containing protein [Gloeothece verrucosa]|uniref:Uncharacterized protein n=1 Tax=Gloeothece verrucosa (strain PCC 7822) TaxID=497965 RepID=E0U6J1_GLOV7|nr:PEP-CTERM sorting domain-containing protein [Gloeothece verrucosa]ADN13634.1 hypothetical protein Cyan7822_1643 [Gloeothece verrucosa PCC 7822]
MLKNQPFLKILIFTFVGLNITTWGMILGQQKTLAAFLTNFSGASSLGVPSSDDDATVVFTVWENLDGNWLDDLNFLGPTFLDGQSNGTERFVYLYQIYNTNPAGGPNLALDQFSVAITGKNGEPYRGNSLYTSGGFMSALQPVLALPAFPQFPLQNPNLIAIDQAANDQTPSQRTAVDFAPPFLPPPEVPPSFPTLNLNAVAANPFLSAFNNELTTAATFSFPDPIPAGVYSPIVFLTSNQQPNFTWAQTRTLGQLGSPGDVSGINSTPIPEPLTVGGVAIAVSFGEWFKRQLSKKKSN